MLLWQEYKEGNPSGYQYSQYCELYRQWRKKLDRSMRCDLCLSNSISFSRCHESRASWPDC
jgi:hypothetical protein